MEGESSSSNTRIFVGGLGGSVTADDIRKTFSSLGTVKAADIIRTNGRSFAYMDFQPISEKALSKLFSTYNGCIWKGGRLRLEKAKEHYLARLRREWEEAAKLASQTPNNDLDALKGMGSSEKPKKLPTLEKMQLHIFFPRLNKVKSLPYSGTGKHKYSFQRTDVPLLPVHFCDCEEHSSPSETARGKDVSAPEAQTGAIDEEELSMMNSVMNKLFARDSNESADYSNQSIDDAPFNENEADHAEDEEDPDNLVINMVTGRNSRLGLVRGKRQGAISADRESVFDKTQSSNDGPTWSQLAAKKRKTTGSSSLSEPTNNKKTCLLPADKSDQNEFASTKPEKKENLKTHSKELKGPTDAKSTMTKAAGEQLAGNLSWAQKSSWRSLVGEMTNSSFSISHILPDIASTRQELPKSNCSDAAKSIDNKQQNLVKQAKSEHKVDGSKALVVEKMQKLKDNRPSDSDVAPSEKEEQILARSEVERATSGKNPQEVKDDSNHFTKPPEEKSYGESKKTFITGPGVGEIRTLVKSDAKLTVKKRKTSRPLNAVDPSANEKPLLPSAGENDRDEVESTKTEKERDSETHSKEGLAEAQSTTEPKASTQQLARGLSWVQKSSWRELVGEAGNSSFSISNILPGIDCTKQDKPNSKRPYTANANDSKQQNLVQQVIRQSTAEISKASVLGKREALEDKVAAPSGCDVAPSEKDEQVLAGLQVEKTFTTDNTSQGLKDDGNVSTEAAPEMKDSWKTKKTSMGEAGSIGEFCSFMRSAVSEREWTKTRAALSGSLKKNSKISSEK